VHRAVKITGLCIQDCRRVNQSLIQPLIARALTTVTDIRQALVPSTLDRRRCTCSIKTAFTLIRVRVRVRVSLHGLTTAALC